jgi:hypothetical protein
MAANIGDLKSLKKILPPSSINLYVGSTGQMLLHLAVLNCCKEDAKDTILEILKMGADVMLENTANELPVDIAVRVNKGRWILKIKLF